MNEPTFGGLIEAALRCLIGDRHDCLRVVTDHETRTFMLLEIQMAGELLELMGAPEWKP